MPPMPEPMMQPVRHQRLVRDRVLEAGVAHCLDNRRPGVMHVSVVTADLLLRHHGVGVEALDSPATWLATRDGSNLLILPIPLRR